MIGMIRPNIDEIKKRLEAIVTSLHFLFYCGLVGVSYYLTESLGLALFAAFIYMYIQKKFSRPDASNDSIACIKIVHYTLLGVLFLITPFLWLVMLVMIVVVLSFLIMTKTGRKRWNIWKN